MRVSQDGLNATRVGQVTDRFSRAVDQLGSDKLRSSRNGEKSVALCAWDEIPDDIR